jgi:hypothetical protein
MRRLGPGQRPRDSRDRSPSLKATPRRTAISRFDNLGKDAAIETIIRFVQSLEPAPIWSEWYVGTTDDINRRLYEEDGATHTKSFYASVYSAATARNVEKHLITRYRMDGKPSGVDNPRFVYAFKETKDTDSPL